MRDLPRGTVTFLFTDIEGSTRLVQDLGERYSELLAEHRRVLRRAFETHGGIEVNTQGDACFAAFARASDAVAAAAEAQLALAQGPVRVRMGLHTGEPTVTADDYVGVDVHRAARIAGAAHGGQVLLSEQTAGLLGGSISLRDLGLHRLRDLTGPQRLYQLRIPGLTEEFAALQTVGNRPTNLPVQPSPFIGRERELLELRGLLRADSVRLLTLTGPGGVGKTRLALQAGADLLDDFRSGVFFVPLAPIRDPGLVAATIAHALGLGQTLPLEVPGEELLDSLVAYLEDKELLLLLDNFEQVVEAAETVGRLLVRALHLKMLVTTRERLRLSAERLYNVPSLTVPEAGSSPDVDLLGRTEAVALFLTRAQAVKPDFALTTQNGPAIAEICRRLDGLPLAIELAAARSPTLPPGALLARLNERLPLLTGGARDVDERQRTLKKTIEWSYERLPETEQVLFAGLAVFVGGCRLEAAAAVFDPGGGLGIDLVDGLQSLVEKSLLRERDDADGEPRLRMLDTIQEYAVERLQAAGDLELLKRRHAEYFIALAEEAYLHRLERAREYLLRLSDDHNNLRSALEYFASYRPEQRLRLAAALGWFWAERSHHAEGRQQLESALAAWPKRDVFGARGRLWAGYLTAATGEPEAGQELLADSLAILQDVGDNTDRSEALELMGRVIWLAGDYSAAERHFEQSLELRRELGQPELIARSMNGLCQVLVVRGDVEQAEPLAERLGDSGAHFFADCALLRGDGEAATVRYCRAMAIAWQRGSPSQSANEMDGLAMAAVLTGEPDRAFQLAGAAAAQRRRLGITRRPSPWWNDLVERSLDSVRRQLGSERSETAWQAGLAMDFERAIEYALGGARATEVGRPG